MDIDLRTLLLADALLSLVLGAVLLAVRPSSRPAAAVTLWATSYGLFGLSKLAVVFHDLLLPDPRFTLANGLALAAYLTLWHAVARLTGRPRKAGASVALGLAVPGLFALLPAGGTTDALRLAGYSAIVAALLAGMVVGLQAEAARLRGRRVVQAALGLHAALIAVRAVLGVVHGPGGVLDPRPGQLLFFLSMAGITVATVAGLLMMLHDAASRRLEQLALTDPLTGLLNRRGLLDPLPGWLRAAEASGRPISALLLDVDHFKSVNDRFGHATGDQVLIELARCLRAVVPPDRPVGRVGGEEFAVLLSADSAGAVQAVGAAIRQAVAGVTAGPGGPAVTVSIGIAHSDESEVGWDPERLLRAADARLYIAKRTRDTIVATSTPGFAGHAIRFDSAT